MNKKLIVAVAVLVPVVAIGAFLINTQSQDQDDNTPFTQMSPPSSDSVEEPTTSPVTTDQRLYIGASTAPVTIVEYIDYKCPNCNVFHRTTAPEIESTYDDQVRFEIRAYPVIGPDSGRALRGAYCAQDQGVFADYHDAVMDYMWDNFYENQDYYIEIEDHLTSDRLLEITEGLLSDQASFRDCIESEEKNPLLDRDLANGGDDGIRGTPGFRVAGQTFVGRQPLSVFETLIDIELR